MRRTTVGVVNAIGEPMQLRRLAVQSSGGLPSCIRTVCYFELAPLATHY